MTHQKVEIIPVVISEQGDQGLSSLWGDWHQVCSRMIAWRAQPVMIVPPKLKTQ